MADYPAEVQLFKLVGRLGRGIGDTSDVGDAPNLEPISGVKIVCTPNLTNEDGGPIFKSPESFPPVTVFQESVFGTTNASGDVVTATMSGLGVLTPVSSSSNGITLPFGGSPKITPRGWTWTVTVSVGGSFPDKKFVIYGSAGGEFNLATLIQVPPNPGSAVADWQAAVSAAQAAAAAAKASADAAAASAGSSGGNAVDQTARNAAAASSQPGHKHVISDITNISTIGQTIASAASASAVKSALSLDQLNNTSDANKPISSAVATALSAKADLVSGLIPTSQIPALAFMDVFPVTSQANMLASGAQRGDIAIRSDVNATYILAATDPTVLSNWIILPTPTGAVSSVNGQTGVIVLTAANVGAAPTTHTHTASQITDASSTWAAIGRAISAGTGLTGGGTLTADRTISLNAASIASLAKADSAVQNGGGAAALQVITQTAYNALATKSSTTVYVIVG